MHLATAMPDHRPLAGVPDDRAGPAGSHGAPAASGRVALFQRIYAEHLGIVWNTARAFALTVAEQEELVQEILIALWDGIVRSGTTLPLPRYVSRVAHDRALSWIRPRPPAPATAPSVGASRLPATAPRRHQGECQRRLNRLGRAIRSLRPIEKTMCLLYLKRLSPGEMAEVLGVSPATRGVHRPRRQPRFIEEGLPQ